MNELRVIARLENWDIDFGQYGARLTGQVFGHPDFLDGTKLSTKVERKQFKGNVVVTRTVAYQLGRAKA